MGERTMDGSGLVVVESEIARDVPIKGGLSVSLAHLEEKSLGV